MKKLLSTFIVISIFLGLLVLGGQVRAQEEKMDQIAYVDMQELFFNHPDKLAAEEQLNLEAKRLQNRLEEEAVGITKEERQVLLQSYQEELNNIEKQLVSRVMEDIDREIGEVARAQGVTIVLDKEAVIYGGYDLTDDILAVIDTRLEEVE